MKECLKFFSKLCSNDNPEGTDEEKKRIMPLTEEQEARHRELIAAFNRNIFIERPIHLSKKTNVEMSRKLGTK